MMVQPVTDLNVDRIRANLARIREQAGPDVEILAAVDGHPVAARENNLLVLAFHPEIAGERRLHELFLSRVQAAA